MHTAPAARDSFVTMPSCGYEKLKILLWQKLTARTQVKKSNGNNRIDEEKNKDLSEFKSGSWIKKKDGGARMREMEDEDKRWEKESGGNPRWGEGRTAHLYGK
ncbi:unnamed protein product [Alternaria alternata]